MVYYRVQWASVETGSPQRHNFNNILSSILLSLVNRQMGNEQIDDTMPLLKRRLLNVNKKVQLDATICRHLFTAKSLYMFRASQHPSSGALKTVTATSGVGHDTGTATSFQRGLIRTLEGSSCTSIMTYTRGSGYSF